MKKMILRRAVGVLTFATFLLISRMTSAQTGNLWFQPDTAFFTDSITSTLTFAASLNCYGIYGPFLISGSSEVTPNPNYVSNSDEDGPRSFPLIITVPLGSLGCFVGSVTATGPYTSLAPSFFVRGYVYDPKIVGRVSLDSDILNLGSVPIGTDDSMLLNVQIGTFGSIFRELYPLNVQVPFSSADSIVPTFNDCFNISPSSDFFYFHPAEIGHYVDTTYLYDPIRKDSTMLILVGEGVAVGVVESTPHEPAMQVYPNPCDQFANVVLPPEGVEQVEIRNALGAIVQSYRNVNSDFTIDASLLPGGIYFIGARAGDSVDMKKLVVIH